MRVVGGWVGVARARSRAPRRAERAEIANTGCTPTHPTFFTRSVVSVRVVPNRPLRRLDLTASVAYFNFS